MCCKKIVALCLSAALMAAMLVPAYAAVTTPGGTGETTVNLTAEAATFSVEVPTSIAVQVAADGTATCASNVKITNGSAAAVKVTNIQMRNGTWNLVPFTTDFAKEKVDSKKLGFQMTVNGDEVATDKTGEQPLTHSADAWTMDSYGASLDIQCAAKASAVSEAISADESAATIVFTIGWAK